MPASRSRTERWRDCLQQVFERDGALELAMPSGTSERQGFSGGTNLIWRVKILALNEREIHVEQPTAMGSLIDLAQGLTLVAVMSIGQNRWMFHTRSLGAISAERGPRVLRLEMPQNVERVQRRNFYRISTAEIALPTVECWPLLDPSSVAVAEVANRAMIQELNQSEITGRVPAPAPDDSLVLPEVGPKFPARLVNLGGGGAGLLIRRDEAGPLERARVFWLRIDLTPNIPAPIAMTARLAHTRYDSEQNIHAGMAFEFSFHPSHKSFVVDQIARYVGLLQRRQMAAAVRKSA
ncbi:MAG: hypothetical protein ACKVU4_12030 [Phycisphaerales bacterium]